MKNCPDWPGKDPLMIEYHDRYWGVPVHDDRIWSEFIFTDTFQAGLSWRTILHKCNNFRNVFDDFDLPVKHLSACFLKLPSNTRQVATSGIRT